MAVIERFAGRFALLRLLGEGGMGQVWHARDLNTSAERAIKRLKGTDPERQSGLAREFEALTRIRHPAVVAVHEHGVTLEGEPFLVLEYVPGRPADEAVAPGDWRAACVVGIEVASGLAALHAAGIAHGDLKPANVLVTTLAPGEPVGAVRLLDFGLAALAPGEAGHRGTPGFAAPEVVAGGPPDAASDLYGLGATLFTLLTGLEPFPGPTAGEKLRAQSAGAPLASRLEAVAAPPALRELILLLLDPDPATRGDARAVRRELEAVHPRARRPLVERLRTTALVGRERELARLESWRRSRHGPRLMWLEGEAGAGCTTLLDELARRATLAGERVLSLSCAGGAAGGVVRSLVQAWGMGLETPATGSAVAEWMAGDAPLTMDDVARLAEAAAPLGATFATDGALILLDDAEVLEPPVAAWLRRAVAGDGASRLRWVVARRVTTRPAEEDATLVRAGFAGRLVLGALDRDAIARLAESRLGAPPPPELVDHLFRAAAGHPGFTVECLAAAAARGALRETAAGFACDPAALEASRPAALETALLDRLGNETGRVLHAARALAASGIPLTAAQVETLTGAAADRALARLRELGVAAPDSDGRWSPRPASLAAALWAATPSPVRRSLTDRVLALSGVPSRRRFELAREIGAVADALRHAEAAFIETGDPRLAGEAADLLAATAPARAALWHDRAAEAWRARGRYHETRRHVEQALALDPDPSRRPERYLLCSTAALRSGQPADVLAIVEAALPEQPGSAIRSRLLVNRAVARGQLGDRERERCELDAAVELAIASGDDLAQGFAYEAATSGAFDRGEYDLAETLAPLAAESYARAGHRVGQLRSIGWRGVIASQRGRSDEAVALLEEAVARARSAGERFALGEQLLVLASVQAAAGRWSGARDASAEAARLALEDGRSTEATIAWGQLAQFAGLLGLPREASRHSLIARRLARAHRPELAALAWRSRAQAERIRGRTARSLRFARRALALAARSTTLERSWCRLELARALAAADRWTEAGAACERWIESTPPTTLGMALLAILAGRAALRRPDLARARECEARVASWLETRIAPQAAAHLELLRAEIAFARHEYGDAVAAGTRALEALAQLPGPAERAEAALALARLAEPAAGLRETVLAWTAVALRYFERAGHRRGREAALAIALEWHRIPAQGAMTARESGLLERVVWLLHSLADPEELGRRAMQAAVEQLDAERGVLLLADPASGELLPVAEFGAVEAATRRDAVRYSRRIARQVADSGSSVLIVDAPADRRGNSPSMRQLRLQSILCVPMFLGGRTVGAVYLDDSRRAHAFGDRERGLLEGFAHLMAVAIEKSRGHDEVRREMVRLEGENVSLRRAVGSRLRAPGLIGSSEPMRKVLADLEHAAKAIATVLITGENGTGKQMVARQLHYLGRRADKPFIEVNCGAIPENLVEAEFFGICEKTATGVRGRPGCFELAHGGTLFLDEVGEASPHAQVALLSAIANREVTPVGGGAPVAVDVRIVTATNRDLRRLVAAGTFRTDLFYRLNVIPIELPPLRERKADIPALVRHFLERFAEQQEREVPALSGDFLAVLMQCDWPGNVRELQNYIERVMAMTPGRVLRPDPPPMTSERPPSDRRLPAAVGEIELRLIREALAKARGNQSQAARDLGLTEQAVRYRLKKYGLPPARENRRIRHK